MGDFKGAIVDFDEVLNIELNNLFIYVIRGNVYWDIGGY